jgi:diaminohydroxyphosphoribosylaminopyrimidine deaminase/5-amino-6-(5-phosphoribosylamino)uracil reductase
MYTVFDQQMMARALQLAHQGLYSTMPNPRVGCVIARDDQVLGEGFTQPAGQDHAEVQALKACRAAGRDAAGATAYVTLEPCSHYGRTPPCANALLEAGIKRVVAAMVDPNPLVAGKGLAMLAEQGLETTSGLMADEARELNIGFVSRMERGRPWLRLKLASSLDGKTALLNGQSKWITGEQARTDVHRWRARSCAMLTGSGTVLADDPELTVRLVEAPRQSQRIMIDSRLRVPAGAKIIAPGTLVVCGEVDDTRIAALQARGAEVLSLPDARGKVDLVALMPVLGARGFNEVMVEAGAGLAGGLMQRGLVDELLLYQAPVLMGDQARGLLDWPALTSMQQCLPLQLREVRQIGNDIRMILRPA